MTEYQKPVEGRRVLTDPRVSSSLTNRLGRLFGVARLPAFLSRPWGAPVYHGFPTIEETLTDGWRFGAISSFDDEPNGCVEGDGFVVAPDGSRAGIVWEVGTFSVREILPPDNKRWGVYSVAFPRPIKHVGDLTEAFRHVLPELREVYSRVKGRAG